MLLRGLRLGGQALPHSEQVPPFPDPGTSGSCPPALCVHERAGGRGSRTTAAHLGKETTF